MTTPTIIITEDIIRRVENGEGGFSRVVLEALGVPWPPKRGWKDRIIGTSRPSEPLQALLVDGDRGEIGKHRARGRRYVRAISIPSTDPCWSD
jgi:hypothetical protein